MQERVAVIIPNLNGRHHLERCLPSIREWSGHHDPDIIVVDNGSTDETAGWLAEHWPDVALLRNSVNSFSAACNAGIEASAGCRYLLLLNNDTVFQSDVVGELVRVQQEAPNAGLVGGRLILPSGATQVSAQQFPRLGRFVAHQLGLSYPFLDRRTYYPYGPVRSEVYEADVPTPVQWLSGACLLFSRDLVDEIGILDEGMPFGVEDVDFARRSRDAGYENYYVPSATLLHVKGATRGAGNGELPEFVADGYRRGLRRYFKKHFSPVGYGVAMVAFRWGSLLRGLVSRIRRLLAG